MNTKNFYLELGQLSEKSVNNLEPSFADLPSSEYLDGDYRLRRYSRFKYFSDNLIQLPSKAFSQNSKINHFQGDLKRTYQEIKSSVIKSHAFSEMFRCFKEISNVDDDSSIEVHQIRILGKHQDIVEVAPEGVHQDGFNFVGVFVIDRSNVAGGEICVHPSKEQAPILKHAFDNGEFIVLNDKRFWHSASALKATNEAQAHLDLFVLTA